MVNHRTSEMVLHTMMLKGVSLLLLGNADTTSFGILLASSFQQGESLLKNWVIG
jgi:hypothetical protein